MALVLWLIAVAMVLNGLKVAIADRRILAGVAWIFVACLIGPGGVNIFGIH